MADVDRQRYRKTYIALKRTKRYVKTYPDVLEIPNIGPAPFSESISAASQEMMQQSIRFLSIPSVAYFSSFF